MVASSPKPYTNEYSLPSFASMTPATIAAALCTTIDETTFDLNSYEDDLADPSADFSWTSVMDRLELINDPLHRLWDAVSLLSRTKNSPELRAVVAAMQEQVLAIHRRPTQSTVVFHAMAKLRASDESATFSPEQKRILDRAIQHSILNGVAMDDYDRGTFNAQQLQLTALQRTFTNNLVDAISAFSLLVFDKTELDGVPDSALSNFAQNAVAAGHTDAADPLAGPWQLSVDLASYLIIVKHCHNRTLRETMFRAYAAVASDAPHNNVPVIHDILRLRHDQARMLGFDSYAELSLTTKMAPSVAAVEAIIDSLQAKCFAASEIEVAKLGAFAVAHGQEEPLQQWDIPYWTERVQTTALGVIEDEMKRYFPLHRVLEGMFELIKELFGVQIAVVDQGQVDTWHPDVYFYEMRALEQPGEPVIAAFFLDLFARPGEKCLGAWMNEIVVRSKVFGTDTMPVRVPVYCLGMNIPPAAEGQCFVSLPDLSLLFNVFGYGLRVAFSCANYTLSAGRAGVEWDCIEVAGEFLKKFVFSRDAIHMISSHVDTGEPLPDAMFDKLVATMQFMGATDYLRRKLHVAATDMSTHHHFDPLLTTEESMFDLFNEYGTRFRVVASLSDDRTLCRLVQIFAEGYGAGYYSYVWSDMLASDAFAEFENATSRDQWQSCGRKFRDTILARTGSCNSDTLFEKFLGRQPTTDALLKQRGITK
ncbi:Aste57867_22263 [Aphanomyces stellatus]|uniref:oligopeptidase A n=1 Tax=Aphanomyces stellatus TaxID=120398 RepID=A0A485LKI5_9STRA|nr:hypothetical protein As57867_022193 [Aphanomyces stellatus]VFT98930.1 Aste57867_22263 [Aphanomyces stellatus]